MWGPDNRIYFLSDRDGRMNLFSTDSDGQGHEATHHASRISTSSFPRSARNRLFSNRRATSGVTILASGKAAPVPIEIKEDFASGRVRVCRCVEAYRIGQHRAGCATGHRGRARRSFLGADEGRHGAQPDQDFECARARRGLVAGREMDRLQLRRDRRERALRPFPGRQRPAATDNQQRRYLLLSGDLVARQQEAALERPLATAALCRCREQSGHGSRSEQGRRNRVYDWSPDSQWIAWSRPEENDSRQGLSLLRRRARKSVPSQTIGIRPATSTFSDDGKYLMFTSSRDFKPTFGENDFPTSIVDLERVYLVTLAKDTESPLGPRSDEVGKRRTRNKKDKRQRMKVDKNGEEEWRQRTTRTRKSRRSRSRSKSISMAFRTVSLA